MKNLVILFVIALCGTCTSSSINRIAGGFPVTSHDQFPFMISLQQKSLVHTLTRGHRCGGALVSLRHAVTSASCLYNNVNGVYSPLNVNDYRVFAGAIDLTNDTSADRHRDVERFTVHPNYHLGIPFVNDIAVITFTSAFSANNVRIVPLATSDAQQHLFNCTSSGWGSHDSTNVPSPQLMHLEKTVLTDNIQCQRFYDITSVQYVILQNSMICGTSVGSSSSCQGDFGNPLVCDGNLHGILINTAYSNCSENMLVQRPEVYTRITSFRSWIRTTAGASNSQPAIAVLAVITIFQIIRTSVLN